MEPPLTAEPADIDLGRWLKGAYAIPGEPADETETDETPPPA